MLAANTAYRLLNPTKALSPNAGYFKLNPVLGASATTPGSSAAPPPPPASSGAGGAGGGGSLSDPGYYMSLIQNDPLYKQTGADLSAAGVADAANTGAQVLRGLVDRGIVPDFGSIAGKLGLSPQIVDWIKNNVDIGQAKGLADQANASGVSQEAQLEHAHQLATGNISAQLAARGLLRSGANAFLNGEEQTKYTNAQHTADQQLADYISGAYQAFANAEQGRQAQLRQAASDAATRQQQIFGSTPAPPPASGGGGSSSGGGAASSPEIPQAIKNLITSGRLS